MDKIARTFVSMLLGWYLQHHTLSPAAKAQSCEGASELKAWTQAVLAAQTLLRVCRKRAPEGSKGRTWGCRL